MEIMYVLYTFLLLVIHYPKLHKTKYTYTRCWPRKGGGGEWLGRERDRALPGTEGGEGKCF